MVPQIDLLPMEATVTIVVHRILGYAQRHPERMIYTHDPINHMGPSLVPNMLCSAANPEVLLRQILQVTGCAWAYWSILAEA